MPRRRWRTREYSLESRHWKALCPQLLWHQRGSLKSRALSWPFPNSDAKILWMFPFATYVGEGSVPALWYPDSYSAFHLLPFPSITALDQGRDALGFPGHIWEMNLTSLCSRSLQIHWGSWLSPHIFRAPRGHKIMSQIDIVPALMETVAKKQHKSGQINNYKITNWVSVIKINWRKR